MKRYLVLSTGGHMALLVAWLISSALLSKPRMSYYAVDLVSSLPSGGPVTPAAVDVPKAPPPPAPVEQHRLPPKEVIKVPGKVKKPPPVKAQKKHGVNLAAALAVLDSTDKKKSRPGIASSAETSISAEMGEAFPFPWYTKAVSDKLYQHWNPPKDFQEDMLCQVDFVIHRDGQITDIVISQGSGDSTFDLFGQRAVTYSNPLPPLPSGYTEDTLHVHMKFRGKP